MRKRTRFLFVYCGNPDSQHMQCKSSTGICSFRKKKHLILGGSAGAGQWLTKKFEPHPPRIAQFIAETFEWTVQLRSVARLSSLGRAWTPC